MSDLSNLLGDVYGDHSPDGPPVRREPAASERSPGWNAPAPEPAAAPAPRFTVAEPVRPPAAIDDDLAAALSAALNDAAATPAPMAPAPTTPAPMTPAPMAPAPVAMAPAPMAPAPAPVYTPPPAPVPVAVPVAPAASVPAPVAMAPAAVAQEARFWMRGDDDIFPKGSKKSKRK